MTDKVPNYTDEQVQMLRDAEPVNYDKATELAEALGKNVRSVIAKCKREGIEYLAKEAEPKRPRGKTKRELVEAIEAETNATLTGLEKAPAQVINTLIDLFEVTV